MQSRNYSRYRARSTRGHVILWRRKKTAQRFPSEPNRHGLPEMSGAAKPAFSHRVSAAGQSPGRRQTRAAALLFAAVFSGTALLLPRCPGFSETLRLSAMLMGGQLAAESAPAVQTAAPSEPLPVSQPETPAEPAAEESQPPESTYENKPESEPEEAAVSDIAPENQAVLVHKTYTASPSDVYVQVGSAFVKNVTDYGNNTVLEAEAASPAFIMEDTAEPQVLIMHTHTTECYMPYTGDVYDTTYATRSTDNSRNMAAVGEVIAEQLEQAGIGVLHDVTQHDYPSYNGSYERSAATVRDYLAKYPTIKVVLDIHRDAIVSGDTVTAPVVETAEGTAAQVMIISGCDDGTMDYPNWRDNLAFAIDLQQQMEGDHPGFTRPILFDYRLYNQNLTTGSLLIEVGSHGNTLPQALLAGEWIGKALAEVLK